MKKWFFIERFFSVGICFWHSEVFFFSDEEVVVKMQEPAYAGNRNRCEFLVHELSPDGEKKERKDLIDQAIAD